MLRIDSADAATTTTTTSTSTTVTADICSRHCPAVTAAAPEILQRKAPHCPPAPSGCRAAPQSRWFSRHRRLRLRLRLLPRRPGDDQVRADARPRLDDLVLESKTGGASGDWGREIAPPRADSDSSRS